MLAFAPPPGRVPANGRGPKLKGLLNSRSAETGAAETAKGVVAARAPRAYSAAIFLGCTAAM